MGNHFSFIEEEKNLFIRNYLMRIKYSHLRHIRINPTIFSEQIKHSCEHCAYRLSSYSLIYSSDVFLLEDLN